MSGPASLFDDGKDAGAMRTIGEVSAALGIKPHVLRYWEQQFPMLTPLKRSGGRRLYRPEDVALVERIDRLVNREGYTLKGAKKAIQSRGVTAAEAAPSRETSVESKSAAVIEPANDKSDIAGQLRGIRDRLAAALAA